MPYKNTPDDLIRTCRLCGSLFQPTRGALRLGMGFYCSRACRDEVRIPTAEVRFWAAVPDVEDSAACWEWQGARDQRQYGSLKVNNRGTRAHRFSWILHNGAIPDGLLVLHKCDNPPCVNPSHLFLGTHLDNSNDKIAKGRYRGADRDVLMATRPRGSAHGCSVLTEETVRLTRERYAAGGCSLESLARELNVSKTAVAQLIRRQTWKHI